MRRIMILMLIVGGLLLPGVGEDARGQGTSAAKAAKPVVASGLEVGETVEPWRPVHVAGPDRGTTACPVCTYLEKPAVVVFTRDGDDVVDLARRVEALVKTHRGKGLKGFVVVIDGTPEKLAKTAKLAGVSLSSLCYPDPSTRSEDLQAYKINPSATRTILVYKDYKVAAKFVELSAKDFGRVEAATAKLVR